MRSGRRRLPGRQPSRSRPDAWHRAARARARPDRRGIGVDATGAGGGQDGDGATGVAERGGRHLPRLRGRGRRAVGGRRARDDGVRVDVARARGDGGARDGHRPDRRRRARRSAGAPPLGRALVAHAADALRGGANQRRRSGWPVQRCPTAPPPTSSSTTPARCSAPSAPQPDVDRLDALTGGPPSADDLSEREREVLATLRQVRRTGRSPRRSGSARTRCAGTSSTSSPSSA